MPAKTKTAKPATKRKRTTKTSKPTTGTETKPAEKPPAPKPNARIHSETLTGDRHYALKTPDGICHIFDMRSFLAASAAARQFGGTLYIGIPNYNGTGKTRYIVTQPLNVSADPGTARKLLRDRTRYGSGNPVRNGEYAGAPRLSSLEYEQDLAESKGYPIKP